MVDNYRELAKQSFIATKTYTDEELFDVIEYWSGMDSDEQWLAVKEDLESCTKR